MFAGLSRGGFLSTTGSCRSFGDDADGYCRADGAGCLVMKRLEDAIADGDNVQAILRGAGTNHSANATSITHPHARTQESLYHQVLRDAAVDAEEIGYVEMHGTGTQAGDSTEYASVANELAKGRSQGNPLHIGAVKANLGHSEAAAGITSVIKAILMMREKIIPPHIGARNGANKNLQSSSAKKLRIPQSQIPFEEGKGPGGARKVLVNNFSAAGGNTSLLLQEPPSPGSKGEDPRNPFAILVSAKTRKSLADNLTRLVNYLHKHPDTNLADLAYTTSARRMHHDHRHAFVVNDVPETVKSLIKARTNAGNNTPPQKSKNDQIAFVFSGQGSQYTGMGGQLFVFCSVFREKILECEKLCLDFGFPSIIHFIQGASSSDDMVFSPMQTQLALVSLEIAMAMLWQSWGIHPRLVIGHSLGEYAALNVSGVIPLASTLYLVGKRAQLMQKSCTPNSHSMLVAQETLERVHHHIQQSGAKDCKVSCVNGPRNIVISATNKHICELERYLGTKNVRTTFLEVPYAFHSSQMNPLLDEIKVIAEGVHFSPPKIPFASTVEGRVIEHDKMLWSTYVKQQTRHPVLMSDAVSACQELGFNEDAMWIECGPGSACLKMIKAVLGTPNSCLLASLDTREKGWMTICKSICKAYERGLTISWKDFHRDYRDCLRLLELPSYSFDLENHWIQYNGRWSLTKGDEPPVDSAPAVFTTCLQRLVSSKTKDNHFHAVFESWLADPGLKGLISGHRVHGFDLCPASVFTEMALSAAFHVHSQGGNPEMVTIPALELRDMQIFNPLVLNPRSTSQKAEIIGIQDLDTGIISIEISSQDGSEITQHARCKVHFGDAEAWRGEWLRSRHFIDDARARLVKSVNTNKSQKLLRGMVYKIFNSLVDYAQEFQSLEEVVMDDRLHEATAMIKLRETSIDHDCIHNPYWIDCLAQLGGFVLNGSAAASPDNVHLAHGWESLRLSGRLSPQKQYTCHVRMMPVSKGVMVGDVYLLDQDAAVATCYGLKFQEMKRHVLHSLLSPIAAKGQARQDSTRSRREDVFLQGEAEFPRYQNGSSLPTESPSTELPDMPTPASTDQDTHVSNQIAIIIAEEIGIDRHDLSDDTVFAEMGLDSLLSISILARLKAETGQILSSSFFTDHPKLEDARRSLGESLPQREKCSGSPKPRSTATPNRSTLPSTKIDTNLYEKIAVIIAEEIGIDRDDISDGTMLAEIGLDSLLAISILTRLREDTGQLLSSSFFNDHPNLEDVRQSLGERPPQREASSASPKPAELNPQGLKQGADGKAASANEHPEPIICPTVHLQGIRSPSPALFLLPEGAGTARMYAEIPDISPTRAVVGIDSPFYSCPEDYQISFEAVASCFVRTIRSIQPYGPYIIGGYSVGGIYAYEVSRQLLSAGEAVQNLIMIDSPCPGVLPPMPAPLLPILEKTGLFESLVTKGRRMPEKMPEITKRHVQQCIAAMEQWSPTFMSSSSGRPERVDVIWGQGLVLECMSKEQRKISDEGWARETGVVTKSKDWFYGIRDGFGPEGWDHLLGASNVICHVVDGHHFSMMKAPQVRCETSPFFQKLPHLALLWFIIL